ncbi:MAG: hypothetical protein Q7S55_01495 [Nanoarchaeota archaeon]|nr:hypothetical protein [Nanoarchaeota archaeon]
MNDRMRKMLVNWRVLLLVTFLLLSVLAIKPRFATEGVELYSVQPDSSAAAAGIVIPNKVMPTARERILSVDGTPTDTVQDYYSAISELRANKTVRLETNKQMYTFLAQENADGKVDVGIRVKEVSFSNVRLGLDLEGGTRVLLQPMGEISEEDLETTVDSLKERLNVYGLKDILVRSASDLEGNNFILIEIAGVTEEEIQELLAKQGKFEAKIGNETVFLGGEKDITYVCRSAECSGIDPYVGCSNLDGGYHCRFFFQISLNPNAAQHHADITKNVKTISEAGSCYLSEDLALYLDDVEVDRLRIGCELKGSATTDIQISGSGAGVTQADAVNDALQNMKKLQTVLLTGSLPVKLEVVKIDTISPSLGKEFLRNVMLVGALALVAVSGVVLVRYRKVVVILPMVLVMLSELVLILGFAALARWNLDLASIAGLIVVVGTGMNHFIVITDETLRKEAENLDWKSRIKNALFIIMGAYVINLGSLIPLFWAGAGLLKGFALTTIIGMSVGVLIARPAYAAIVKILLEE